ncbi:MAG: LuxR C-terminal-related transcriptional regulator [Desulfarculaceae bacterium]|jgi:DNA-binding CsgD family transcriptional regulator
MSTEELVRQLSRELEKEKRARQEAEEKLRRFQEEAAQEVDSARQEIQRSKQELQNYQNRSESLTQRLMENNQALSVLARNLETARVEAQMRIIQRIRTAILPTIERLQQDQGLKKYQPELDMVVWDIHELASSLDRESDLSTVLTTSEHRIATMIKNGMNSREISGQLNISLDTVKTHRRNIRRKLKLNNSSQNLRSYLTARSLGDPAEA